MLFYDTNNDGEIQVTEAEAVTGTTDVNGEFLTTHYFDRIADLTGIEAFINITALLCYDNLLTTIDVNQNTYLTSLDCSKNQLTTLNLSANINLAYLYCRENLLENLNVSTNTELIKLICVSNQLSSLNVNNSLILKVLGCSNNMLTNIDVSQNTLLTRLYCGLNQITSLDVIDNINLQTLWCNNAEISSLDLSQNATLGVIQCQNNQLTYLNVKNGNNNHFAVFNAYNNPGLTCIFVDDVTYSTDNWIPNDPPFFEFDPNSHFVETQAECDELSINEELFEQIKIYPNPIKDSLTIKLSTTVSNKIIIKVSTILGKQIRTKIVSNDNKITIDTSSLSQGVYLISIYQNNKVITKKIIKL